MSTTSLLIVSNFYSPVVEGGAEIVAKRQAEAFKARGYDVAVFAGGYADAEFPTGALRIEEVDGILVYRIALRSLDPAGNFHWPTARMRFKSLLAAHRPDIVHFHNLMGLGVDLIPLARASGAQTMVTLHDHWGFCFKNTLLRNDKRLCTNIEECAACLPTIATPGGQEVPIRLRRDFVAHCLEQADALVSPSRYLADAFMASGVVRHPVEHVSNGIDLAAVPIATKVPDGPIRFGVFGYLGDHKGVSTVMEAAELLAADDVLAGRWTLTFAGHGYLAATLEANIASGRFGDAVRYAGKLDHAGAMEMMRGLHVSVLASVWPENEPVSLLEAVASGTAQMATGIGGNVELVDDGRSGLLFAPGDTRDLAAKMRRFIDEPGLALQFGRHNADRRARFGAEASIDRIEALYDALSAHSQASEIIILCAGDSASPAVQAMVHEFHRIEDGDSRIRFIWHEWADATIWATANLLWFWSDGGVADLPLIGRALRGGISILAPDGAICPSSAQGSLPIASYDMPLTALGHIAARQDVTPDPGMLTGSAISLARLLNAVAPRDCFNLSAATL